MSTPKAYFGRRTCLDDLDGQASPIRGVLAMGTIVPRKRKVGSTAYRAQIVRKQGKKIVYRETQTFVRKQAAKAWLDRRETELREPGAMARTLKDPRCGT